MFEKSDWRSLESDIRHSIRREERDASDKRGKRAFEWSRRILLKGKAGAGKSNCADMLVRV